MTLAGTADSQTNVAQNSSEPWNFFHPAPFRLFYKIRRVDGQGMLMTEDKTSGRDRIAPRRRRGDDGLGTNSDIGAKLRALYGSIQEEPIPDNLLDLLEKLSQVESKDGHDRGR